MALNISKALCGKSLKLVALKGIPQKSLIASRCVTIRAVPAQTPVEVSHDERNMKLNRPQSPHLSIYQFQLTTFLSISHRATGIALTGYAVALGVGGLVLPADFNHYINLIQDLHLSAPTLLTAKFILAYPFAYHVANGIRHLAWDSGKFLKLKEVYSTGYFMLISSFILCAAIASL